MALFGEVLSPGGGEIKSPGGRSRLRSVAQQPLQRAGRTRRAHRGGPLLPLDLLLDAAQGVVPHDIVHEAGEQRLQPPPEGPAHGVRAPPEIEGRVDRQLAVAVPRGRDVEDQAASPCERLAHFVHEQVGADPPGQAEINQPSGEAQAVAHDRPELVRSSSDPTNLEESQVEIIGRRFPELAELFDDLLG